MKFLGKVHFVGKGELYLFRLPCLLSRKLWHKFVYRFAWRFPKDPSALKILQYSKIWKEGKDLHPQDFSLTKIGNGRNTVSRVLFQRRELTEPH